MDTNSNPPADGLSVNQEKKLSDIPAPSAGWYRRNRLISDLRAELADPRKDNADNADYELDLITALTEIEAVQDDYNAARQALKEGK